MILNPIRSFALHLCRSQTTLASSGVFIGRRFFFPVPGSQPRQLGFPCHHRLCMFGVIVRLGPCRGSVLTMKLGGIIAKCQIGTPKRESPLLLPVVRFDLHSYARLGK